MKKILIVTLTLMLAVVFVACAPAESTPSPAEDIADDTMEETDGDPVAEIPEDDMTEDDTAEDGMAEDDMTEDDMTEDDMTEDDMTEDDMTEDDMAETFDFAGTSWQASQMIDAEGNTLDAAAIEAALGGIPVMTLNDDGTAVAVVGESETTGTWTFDGTTFLLNTDAGEGQGTLEGNMLTIVEAQGTTVYELVAE